MKRGFLKGNTSGKKKEKKESTIKKSYVDRISGLPNVLTHHILSFLDMKQVVRTSLLSRKWRDVWVSLHALNIDDSFWLKDDKRLRHLEFLNFVDKVLLCRDGSNVDKFHLKFPSSYNGCADNYVDRVCAWVTCVVRRNVQDLHLHVIYMPPLFSFCYSTSLKTLRLTNATLPIQVEESWCAPNLESLTIQNCRHHYLECINISSPQLKYLRVNNDVHLVQFGPSQCELKIRAPNLVSLECTGYMYQDYSLKNLSSLVTACFDTWMYDIKNRREVLSRCLDNILSRLTNAKTITVSVYGIQNFAEIPSLLKPVPISFPNLKCLNLKEWRNNGYIRALTRLIGNFSGIETLILERAKEKYKPVKVADWAKQLLLECKFYKLKSVEIQNIEGCENELKFIEYLLKNATVLEKMTITATNVHSGESEELSKFSMKLNSLPRASSTASVVFLQKS